MKPLVEFKLLREGAKLPSRGSLSAGGLDVFAPCDGVMFPGDIGPVPLGIAHQINDSYDYGEKEEWCTQGFLISRSGLARNCGFKLFFDPCLIDHDYRGEIVGVFQNMGRFKFEWKKGDRICQLVYSSSIWTGTPGITEVLTETARGTGGFGSSGR
jgi:dUTP pyrophosphatase